MQMMRAIRVLYGAADPDMAAVEESTSRAVEERKHHLAKDVFTLLFGNRAGDLSELPSNHDSAPVALDSINAYVKP